MKILAKYWKVLLAVILATAAVYVYLNTYKTEKADFESKTANMGMMILALENKIQENVRYADIQDELEEGIAASLVSSTICAFCILGSLDTEQQVVGIVGHYGTTELYEVVEVVTLIYRALLQAKRLLLT